MDASFVSSVDNATRSNNQNFTPYKSQALNPQAQRLRIRDRTPVPANVIDLLQISDGGEKYHIASCSFNMIKIVGIVLSSQINLDENCVAYEVCDSTVQNLESVSSFPVIRYTGIETHSQAIQFPRGNFLQAVGNLRNHNGRLSLVSFNIRELSCVEEVETFQLETILAKHYYKAGTLEIVSQPNVSHLVNNNDNSFANYDNSTNNFVHAEPMESSESIRSHFTVRKRPNNEDIYQQNLLKRASLNRPTEFGDYSNTAKQNSNNNFNANAQRIVAMGVSNPMKQRKIAPLAQNPNSNAPPSAIARIENSRGLLGQKAKIYEFVRRYGVGEMGVSLQDIVVGIGASEASISGDINVLINNSIIYSTIDAEHFASIDD